ncbi:phage shock protein C (PspC) family protein [Actinorugispora endophytica]|uniref:Phage shock protein C (PspC) family protein n=2 Tax=Actinorugispora endophytica TaxID=1605990 RepID=A0A4V3D8T0_9ACTN|nr:phage shock protein C (PspC) family protein [Actinorugispora endophytica]
MGFPARGGHSESMNENFGGKSFRRSSSNRLITGVCGGIGEFVGVDANIVRLAFAVFTLLGGSGVLLYIIAWLVMPEEGGRSSVIEHLIRTFQGKESKL